MALMDHWKDTLIEDMRELMAGFLAPTSLLLFGLTSRANYAWVMRHEQKDWTNVPMRRTSVPLVNSKWTKPREGSVACARLGTLALLRDGNDALVSDAGVAKLSPRTILAFPFSVRILPRYLKANGNWVDPANILRDDPINDTFIGNWLTREILDIMVNERGMSRILTHRSRWLRVVEQTVRVDNVQGLCALLSYRCDFTYPSDLSSLKHKAFYLGAMECLKELHARYSPVQYLLDDTGYYHMEYEMVLFLDAHGAQFTAEHILRMVISRKTDCVRFLLDRIALLLTEGDLVSLIFCATAGQDDAIIDLLISKVTFPLAHAQLCSLLSQVLSLKASPVHLLRRLLSHDAFAVLDIPDLVCLLQQIPLKSDSDLFPIDLIRYMEARQHALTGDAWFGEEAFALVNYFAKTSMINASALKILAFWTCINPRIAAICTRISDTCPAEEGNGYFEVNDHFYQLAQEQHNRKKKKAKV